MNKNIFIGKVLGLSPVTAIGNQPETLNLKLETKQAQVAKLVDALL
jgi:hypothetical protein